MNYQVQQYVLHRGWVCIKDYGDDIVMCENHYQRLRLDPENAKYKHWYRIAKIETVMHNEGDIGKSHA
jgi:hypothetical protein